MSDDLYRFLSDEATDAAASWLLLSYRADERAGKQKDFDAAEELRNESKAYRRSAHNAAERAAKYDKYAK